MFFVEIGLSYIGISWRKSLFGKGGVPRPQHRPTRCAQGRSY
jgi:hypothetical protein